jgi:hypothetical protein
VTPELEQALKEMGVVAKPAAPAPKPELPPRQFKGFYYKPGEEIPH